MLDALQDPLPIDKDWLILLPRIDTEFEDTQLKELFKKLYNKGVRYILFSPVELLSLRIILAELKIYLIFDFVLCRIRDKELEDKTLRTSRQYSIIQSRHCSAVTPVYLNHAAIY